MPRTLNLLHLSDLHYSRRHSHNVQVIVDALLPSLSQLSQTSNKPDVVVFSGDFVDAADDPDAYLYFHDDVVEKIRSAVGCSLSRFIFTPGNHDVQRSAVARHIDKLLGLSARLISRDVLNDAYCNSHLDEVTSDKFSAYHRYLELIDIDEKSNGDLFYQVHHMPELGLDVAVANTSWMSWAGTDGRNDFRQLLFPEAAATALVRRIEPSYDAMLVTHHPLNWLTTQCENDFSTVIADTIGLHMFGHMHEAQPVAIASMNGRRLNDQAGALYSGRERYIGYSLIKHEVGTENFAVHLFAYSDQRRAFHPAEQLLQGGIFYPSQAQRQLWRTRAEAPPPAQIADWVGNVLLPKAERELNEGLTDRRLCDVFVPPPLTTGVPYQNAEKDDSSLPERQETHLSFDDFVKSNVSYVVFGNAEWGKTTLLKQTALRLMQESLVGRIVLPIIMDFTQVGTGRDKILRVLKANLAEEGTGWTLRQLLTEGLVTVLIDDVIFTDLDRMEVLRRFVSDYPRNRYIFAVTLRETVASHTISNPDLSIATEPVFMRQMTRSAMRSLVGKWDHTERINRDDVLRRLLHEMSSINVPMTAVNGTILLTIYENQANFKAINRAVLIENFIETLLDKRSSQSAERRTFDFTNQKHLLSFIAGWMSERDVYVVETRMMRDTVQSYLDNRGLPNDAVRIIDDFLMARIFASKPTGEIHFRYRAFLEYFIANQMRIDTAFRSWVLDDARYLRFVNEIIYYAGIDRSDSDLLSLVGERFAALKQNAVSGLGWSPDLRSLEAFALPTDDADSQMILNEFERQIGAPPLTAEEQDEILEAEMPQDVESRQEVFRPKADEAGQKLILGLMLCSGAVRDLECLSKLALVSRLACFAEHRSGF